jgi:GWxTD domain-containing protein
LAGIYGICLSKKENYIIRQAMKTKFYSHIPIACFLSLMVLSLQSRAQGLDVSFDYATFKYDSSRTYAEVYYSFNATTLHFTKVASHDSSNGFLFSDSLIFDVSVRQADSIVARQTWKIPVTVSDTTSDFLRKNLVGMTDFVLHPGKYMLVAHCFDLSDSLNRDSLKMDFPIPSYNTNKLEASSVELCATITQGKNSETFYKNTYDVVPNPTATYGLGMPIIYYYLELYNIPSSPSDSLFTAGYEILDSYGQVRKSSYRTRKKFGASSVEVGTVNGSNLRTGAYTFSYVVVDSGANLYATTSRRFFVYNPNLGKPEAPDSGIMSRAILATVFSGMGEEQLNKEFAEAHYIANSAEINQYKELATVEAKRQFLYEFWEKRNSLRDDSKTNNARTQYLERVAYANDHFRASAREGWHTDRGRVYILYGTPDEIDRHPNESSSKPYEIWYYNSLEGGVSFDFVDRSGFGDYSLVNSTKRDEVHDDNWQQYLAQ